MPASSRAHGSARRTGPLLACAVVAVLLMTVAPGSPGASTPGSRGAARVADSRTGSAPLSPAVGLPGVGGWTNLTGGIPNAPPPRSSMASAYDAALNETIVFGGLGLAYGNLRTTWAYADGGWRSIGSPDPNATNTPSSRYGAMAAYDPALGDVVLFGGRNLAGALLQDTWEFSASGWTNVSGQLTLAPPARVNGSFAYDPASSAVVLFGGRTPSQVDSDTWAFDGSAWSSIGAAAPTPSNTPDSRFGAVLQYSTSLDGLVLFGGTGFSAGTYPLLDDTWEFTATGWTELAPSASPPPRSFAPSAPLPLGGVLVFGGLGASGPLADTWFLNGTVWTDETSALGASPPARSDAVATEVTGANGTDYVLLFGGLGAGGSLGDTWAVAANGVVLTQGAASPATIDENSTTTLTIVAFGPVENLTYAWSQLPEGCSSANSSRLACTPTSTGRYSVLVNVSTPAPATYGSQRIPLLVNSPVVIRGVIVSPFPLHLGSGPVGISVETSGGTPPLNYSYSGLPTGCLTNNSRALVCTPPTTGSWTVTVTVQDGSGVSAVKTASVVVTLSSGSRPNHLLSLLFSPLGVTVILVVVALVLIFLYASLRRGRPPLATPAPTPWLGPTTAGPSARPPGNPTSPGSPPRAS